MPNDRNNGRLQSFFAAMCGAPLLAVGIAALLFFLGNPHLMGHFWISGGVDGFAGDCVVDQPAASLKNRPDFQRNKSASSTNWRARPGIFLKPLSAPKTTGCRRIIFRNIRSPVVATRTSPTNIGLALLSALSAYDFGYLSLPNLMEHHRAHAGNDGKTGAVQRTFLQLV